MIEGLRMARTIWIFFTHVHHAIGLSWTVARFATNNEMMRLPNTVLYDLAAMHFAEMAGWKMEPASDKNLKENEEAA